MAAGIHVNHWKRWLGIGIAALALALVAGPYIFFHLVEGTAPAPLTLASPSPASQGGATGSAPASSEPDGAWAITSDSVVGHRVKETLFGQSNDAVGRTSQISGSITVAGTAITAGGFTVDMTTVTKRREPP